MSVRIVGVGGEPELPADVAATVVTVGTFDGVHCGHRDVISRLVAHARSAQRATLLVTFEPHPVCSRRATRS